MRRLLLLLSLIALSACKPALLPETSVADTKENRAVKAFLDKYRSAMECRSTKAVMDLVASDFFENAGTTGQSTEKYGYSELREKLDATFAKIETIKLNYHVQNIERRGELFYVYYYFMQRAQVHYPSESHWVTASDVNRMVLRMKGRNFANGFEILSGI